MVKSKFVICVSENRIDACVLYTSNCYQTSKNSQDEETLKMSTEAFSNQLSTLKCIKFFKYKLSVFYFHQLCDYDNSTKKRSGFVTASQKKRVTGGTESESHRTTTRVVYI